MSVFLSALTIDPAVSQVLYMGGDVAGARDDGLDVVNLMHGREDVPALEVGHRRIVDVEWGRVGEGVQYRWRKSKGRHGDRAEVEVEARLVKYSWCLLTGGGWVCSGRIEASTQQFVDGGVSSRCHEKQIQNRRRSHAIGRK